MFLKSRSIVSFLMVVGFVLIALPIWAKTMYVTDSFEITVRTAPSTEHKIIAMLKTNEAVEILEEQGEWTKVRLENGKEGYALSRYLTPNIPKLFIISGLRQKVKTLESDLKSLSESKEGLEKSNAKLNSTLTSREKELENLKKEYADWKSGATDYVNVKELKDKLEIDNQKLQDKVDGLLEENKWLRRKKDSLWFAIGAGVLLGGWVLGLIMGRAQMRRKRYSLYYP